jgi:phage terminase large subunit-like protein
MTDITPSERQLMALRSDAEILIYGGSAGGGKSFFLLLEAMRHRTNPRYGGVIFRRTHPMIVAEGGLWATSCELYPLAGAKPLYGDKWIFPSGATVRFCHMQYEKNRFDWNSSQLPFVGIDELTEFSSVMFWHLLSRNRSTSGIRPRVRAACNPDAESWVAEFISWWIDQDTGYPLADRRGKIRWFIRDEGEKLQWANSPEALQKKWPKSKPLSVTFIDALLSDNAILESKDPDYRAKLEALPLVERERLLGGNWKIRPAAGLKFPRDKWVYTEACPAMLKLVRFWDKAYTEGGTGAMTAGVLVGEIENYKAKRLPRFAIVHCEAGRWGDAEREAKMQTTAELDRAAFGNVVIGIENEGGAGKQAANVSIANLAGFSVYGERPTAKKHLRWSPLAAQQQIGNVAIIKTSGLGDWDWLQFVRELDALAGDELLDKQKLKDKADAAAGAFKGLTQGTFGRDTELLCSGSDKAEAQPLTNKEVEELPEFWKDLVNTYRGLGDENPRTDQIDNIDHKFPDDLRRDRGRDRDRD